MEKFNFQFFPTFVMILTYSLKPQVSMQRALQTYGLFVYILIFTQRPAAKVSSKTCKMDSSRENDESFDQQLVPGPQERRRNDRENSQDPPRVVAKKAKGKSTKTLMFHFRKTPLLQSTKSQ